MKQAVVYYSMSGCTEFVAKTIAEKYHFDIFKIELVKPYTTVSAFAKGAIASKKEECPELAHPIDISDYDRIWLGCPTWAFTYAAPLNSVLQSNDFSGKEVVFFNTNGGNLGKVFDRIQEKLPTATFLDFKSFKGKKINGNATEVIDWADSLANKGE